MTSCEPEVVQPLLHSLVFSGFINSPVGNKGINDGLHWIGIADYYVGGRGIFPEQMA
jgi:hypothetical protein